MKKFFMSGTAESMTRLITAWLAFNACAVMWTMLFIGKPASEIAIVVGTVTSFAVVIKTVGEINNKTPSE